MSYSIIANHKNGTLKEIPVSRYGTFHKFCLPLFTQHHLQNFIDIKYSHDIEEEDGITLYLNICF